MVEQIFIYPQTYKLLTEETVLAHKSIAEVLDLLLGSVGGQRDILTCFWKNLLDLKKIKNLEDCWSIRKDRIFLYLYGIYMLWAQEYRKKYSKEPSISLFAIRAVLRTTDYFLESNKIHRIQGKPVKCISLLRSKVPPLVKLLIDDV